MLTCSLCSETGQLDNDSFTADSSNQGFWCESCDGYSYFDTNAVKHRFTLILEDAAAPRPIYEIPDIKFRKRLSPLRYPGGKSKLIDYLYSHLQQTKTEKLISPFTGGGSFELAMLHSGVIQQLHLNDLDFGIYSLWWTILHAPSELIYRVHSAVPTHHDYFEAQSIIKSDFFGVTMLEAAWSTLLVNRLAYSGIARANPLGGRKGKQKELLSRWNPVEIESRIRTIAAMSDRITISNMDALELIEEAYWDESHSIFIDPPYFAKGKDLYNCYYTQKDHTMLCVLLESLHRGMPGADIIVTYDYHEQIQNLYHLSEDVIIGRHYSI